MKAASTTTTTTNEPEAAAPVASTKIPPTASSAQLVSELWARHKWEILGTSLYASTTVGFGALGRLVHQPTFLTFIIAWPASETAHLMGALHLLNIAIAYRMNPNIFSTAWGKIAVLINAWTSGRFLQATIEAFGAFNQFDRAFANAQIPRVAGQQHPYWTMALSLIPAFAVSRRFKPLRYERNLEYASLQRLDPELYQQYQDGGVLGKIRTLVTGRGFIGQWMSCDVVVSDPLPPPGAPVVMMVHGGGWVVGDKLFANQSTVMRLASRGIVVVTVNYRLGPDRRFPDPLFDIKRALIWIKANVRRWNGDPDLVFASGESAGGHLAGLLSVTCNLPAFQPPENPNADTSLAGGLPLYGFFDFTDAHGHYSRLFPSLVFGQISGAKYFLSKTVMSTQYAEDPEAWAMASPLMHLRNYTSPAWRESKQPAIVVPPHLIVHGTRDVLTATKDSDEMYKELQKLRALNGESPITDVLVRPYGGHHAMGYIPAPRTSAIADAMYDFVLFHSERIRATRQSPGSAPP